ncbi:hypothetical protein [Stenotrophomonas chelatiphaga]|uniref:hypothetical protein n=1 Tax=Stenotrophomonas chelatiphaga TaxID=517011 RepID=UPI002899D038|nr:hypothetical protein [Stenotrophomonas chelatiphaga]
MHRQIDLERLVSTARWTTYLHAAAVVDTCPTLLYLWNMRLCGALLMPLHLVEILVRNAAAEALGSQHGPAWPRNDAFRRRLPRVHTGYCAGSELEKAISRSTRVDDVVAGLSFAFWHQLFTRRFDQSLWMTGFSRVFPHALPLPSHALRAAAYADLSRLRQLRNRIAHHEPIFQRDIRADLAAATRIIHARSPSTLHWLLRHEEASTVLAASPLEGKSATPP